MLRLRQICLVASELEKPVADLKVIFGLETCFHDPNVAKYGLENALLPVGTDFLEVVAPFQEETAAGRYLDRRGGDGGYMVILQCDDTEAREQRMPEIGVRIASADPRSVAPDGPWHPAGDSWEAAVRTDVVRAIMAAELQSDDPSRLAARWAEVLNVPLGSDAQGNPALKLENAELRFIPADDDRGEGLGGLDLAVADRDAILREAEAWGCDVAGDTVTVCGVRFKLL
jgi:hypothetical protein